MARQVVVIGASAPVAALLARLARPELADIYHVAGVLYDGAWMPATISPQILVLDGPDALLDFAREHNIETAMICVGARPGGLMRDVSLALADLPLDVMLYLDSDCFRCR